MYKSLSESLNVLMIVINNSLCRGENVMILDRNLKLMTFAVQEKNEDLRPVMDILMPLFGEEIYPRNTRSDEDDTFKALHMVKYNRYYTSVSYLIYSSCFFSDDITGNRSSSLPVYR